MELIDIKGVGEKKLRYLNKLGIYTIKNFLEYYPYSYIDTTKFKKISEITNEGSYSYKLKIISILENKKLKNMRITKFLAIDEEQNSCTIVYYNNYFITKTIKENEIYEMYGKAKFVGKTVEIQAPTLQSKSKFIGNILPQYHLTDGISNLDLMKFMKNLLDKGSIEETLPSYITDKLNLISYEEAIKNIHFPKSNELLFKAKKRLAFDEIFYFQLLAMFMKKDNEKYLSFELLDETFEFIKSLPFELTDSQKKVLDDIFLDLKSKKQMNRLIQGDVGCGKTVIALIASFNVIKNGYQVAFMAPTEILAKQHFESSKKLFSKFGIRIKLLVGSLKAKEKLKINQEIENGEVDLIIGTHSLFQEKVIYSNLGLIITDEQHRFGVKQRLLLSKKSDNPDIMVMSATPIPRTVGLVMFCDLDISSIKEMPTGRGKIETYFVSENYEKRYMDFLKKEILKGRQAYIVCPLIDESDNLELQSVSNLYKKLKSKYLQNIEVAFIHGKMKPSEKDEIMKLFETGKVKILISTTVIEVGINVPNANIMVIYNAERFGLSQLHQLRGRIGRGQYDSYCILVSNKSGELLRRRMEIMCSSTDGFYISEQDFLLRGYGDVFGYRQSGEQNFKMVNFQNDFEVLKFSKMFVEKILKEDKNLQKAKNKIINQNLKTIVKSINSDIIMN